MDRRQLAAKVATFGRSLTSSLFAATADLYRPMHAHERPDGVECMAAPYGEDPRQRLKVFRPRAGGALPALIFVPGGGLVTPISRPGSPFFDNIGLWAARHGMVGVTMTCRLAPQAKWPDGARDVAAACAWLDLWGERLGIDQSHVRLLGHSAGAGHVATYLANPDLRRRASASIAGAVLVSGPYNILTLPGGPNRAYYGDDPARYALCNTAPGLRRSGVPLLVVTAEHDAPEFRAQAAELVGSREWPKSHTPRLLDLRGHNHLSSILGIGTADTELADAVLTFCRAP